MDLVFRQLSSGEMERPPTQRDQFDNDDVELVDALVREALQNSLDAVHGPGPVRVRIALHEPAGASKDGFRAFLQEEQLCRHLSAAGIDPETIDFSYPKILVIEDFGTTGLSGRWDVWDNSPFCDFWRRMGLSHKGGKALGRWGLGKLVFSSASQVRVFYGLTVRADDPGRELLMGQAVLTHHKLDDDKRYDSHGFFALLDSEGLQLPTTSEEEIARFKQVCGLARTNEPGLSIVVPHVRNTITVERLVQGLLRNYFFPILFQRLEVTIGHVQVNAATFAALAEKYGGERFAGGHLARFIQAMQSSRQRAAPSVLLPNNWYTLEMEAALGEQLVDLRARLVSGEMVSARAPFLLKRKDGKEERTYVDLFLQRSPHDGGDTLFVRDAIVLPAEAKYFRGRNMFAALVANDRSVSDFLGDAENPAHTSWSASAEKVTGNWKNASSRLREIRESLQRFYAALVSAMETIDTDALVSVFSTPGDDGIRTKRSKGPIVRPQGPKPPRPDAKTYRVRRLSGGFAIQAGPGLTGEMLPLNIRVEAAYDVLRGNPFTKHHPLDFDFRKNRLSVSATGAEVRPESPNVLMIEATELDFAIEVSGFDVNRDLIINPARTS